VAGTDAPPLQFYRKGISGMDGLTIAILSYEDTALLKGCLDSIRDQGLYDDAFIMHNHEVLVIENSESEAVQKIVKKFLDSYYDMPVRLIKGDNTYGFIGGLNLAFQEAKYPNILFLSNDVRLQRNCAWELLHAIEDHPYSIIQPVFLKEWGHIENAGAHLFYPGYGIGRQDITQVPLQGTEIFSTTGFIMKKALYEDVGRFDESLAPAYYEDVDYSIRAKKLHYHSWVCTTAFATHISNYTFSQKYTKKEMSAFCRKNRRRVICKHFKGWRLWLRLLLLR
jgi:GT2 family glycosyltransferase